MKKLFLLRGLPGSGKSTLAEQLGGSHFETDKYFVDEHGNYNFDCS
jgi:predicted kinase